MKPIIIIPCGAKKRDYTSPAGSLYIGCFFKSCLGAARRLTGEESILILSSKYGLLKTDQMIDPYELKMGEPGCVDLVQVKRQATSLGIATSKPIVFCGGRYRTLCETVWPFAVFPLRESGGIGKQMAALKRMA